MFAKKNDVDRTHIRGDLLVQRGKPALYPGLLHGASPQPSRRADRACADAYRPQAELEGPVRSACAKPAGNR